MPTIHDTFKVLIAGEPHEVEHEFFQPDTVQEAIEKWGHSAVLEILQWAIQLEARSKKRQQFVVTFKPIGRGGTTGKRG